VEVFGDTRTIVVMLALDGTVFMRLSVFRHTLMSKTCAKDGKSLCLSTCQVSGAGTAFLPIPAAFPSSQTHRKVDPHLTVLKAFLSSSNDSDIHSAPTYDATDKLFRSTYKSRDSSHDISRR